MFKGYAEFAAAESFLANAAERYSFHKDNIRKFCDIPVSALGMGTYLGAMDLPTDSRVSKTALNAIKKGINFFDTAINYRGQRAERALGEAFRQALLKGTLRRNEFFVSTKGGFVPFESTPETDIAALFNREYVARSLAKTTDLIAQCHCLAPSYIADQIDRSRQNLGLETIDLYYLHNPETQLEELPERLVYEKLFEAFRELEKARAQGKIRYYGIATWNGLRELPDSSGYLSLQKVLSAAQAAAPHSGQNEGSPHGFRAIQMPYNLVMNEGATRKTQSLSQGDSMTTPFNAAKAMGLSVAVSAPLYQGRICEGQPPFVTKEYNPDTYGTGLTGAQRALLFALSTPSVDAVMTGMKDLKHLEENAAALCMKPLCLDRLSALLRIPVAAGQ
jgi:aryl-alcohol dehydrogenase-like predicted oxidoreductase